MRKCFLTIVTNADGRETTFSGEAEMQLTPLTAHLRYVQDGATVELRFENRCVTINRQGEYLLFLQLEEGQRFHGKLGFQDNIGEILVETKKVAYAITDKSLLATLSYTLLFDGANQEMKLRLNAREKNSEEK